MNSLKTTLAFCFFIAPYLAGAQAYNPSTILAVRSIIGKPSVGDFDHDGDSDLLVAGNQWNTPTLKVYESQGGGNFVEKLNSGLPKTATYAIWVDYDGDHDLDAFVANSGIRGTKADFYINTNGAFTPLGISVPQQIRLASFSVIDYDLDGDKDLLIAGQVGPISKITYLLKNVNNVFSSVNSNLEGNSDSSYAWGDFDKDNDLDVFISDHFASKLFQNNGSSLFSEAYISRSTAWFSQLGRL